MPLPPDLRPLPTAPYAERPVELPIDIEEARTAIWRSKGNVTEAASLLKVPPSRLRRVVEGSVRLTREVEEAREQLVDTAENVVREALADPDRQDAMARFVLASQGRKRGWGAGQTNVKINNNGGPMVIQWADGSQLTGPKPEGQPNTIEGTFEEVS